jgi:MerR family transcriptional regulator, copper efflux regulator
MTIGALSRRTGVPVKTLRLYEDLGFLYTIGRSPGNYRLFDDDALWCVWVVTGLRAVGLTLAEIQSLAGLYTAAVDQPLGPRVAALLQEVRNRTGQRIVELEQLLLRLDAFEAQYAEQLAGRADFRAQDPRLSRGPLDSPPRGRP